LDILKAVSETAIITLRARVIEAIKEKPIIEDPVGIRCFDRLQALLPLEIRDRIINKQPSLTLSNHIALRARKYDRYTKEFLNEYPDAMVVSLGAGFDTRYWRISGKPWKYIEIDLPEVIEVKKELLGNDIPYQMISSSVLDREWINQITSMQKEKVLLLAEGLFMYLPKKEVICLFKDMSASFSQSQIAFEVITEKYTRGIRKKFVKFKMKRSFGTSAGSSYDFGINDARDVEEYGDNIQVVEEWSYFEDEDIKPKVFRIFRNCRMFSRTQWTIRATIG